MLLSYGVDRLNELFLLAIKKIKLKGGSMKNTRKKGLLVVIEELLDMAKEWLLEKADITLSKKEDKQKDSNKRK